MNYHLRAIEAKDNVQVEAVIRACLTEFGGNREGLAWTDPDLGRFSELYAPENAAYWVAVDVAIDASERVLGGAGIGPWPTDPRVCELQKMYLLPEARGLGIGLALMRLSLGFAASRYERCYLETLHSMSAAARLYQAQGFRPLDAPLAGSGHFACDAWYIKELR